MFMFRKQTPPKPELPQTALPPVPPPDVDQPDLGHPDRVALPPADEPPPVMAEAPPPSESQPGSSPETASEPPSHPMADAAPTPPTRPARTRTARRKKPVAPSVPTPAGPRARRDARPDAPAPAAAKPMRKAAPTLAPKPDVSVAPNPDDATQPPLHTGGWSERVITVAGAVVQPTSGAGMVQRGGVYDQNRQAVAHAVHWRRGQPLLLPRKPRNVPTPTRHLAGRWLWGGLLLNHFGHFLTESTPRLWGLDTPEAADVAGILFIHKRNEPVTDFHRQFLGLMGVNLPIEVAYEPLSVDELVVPGQGFGIGRLSMGTDRFRAFFRTRFARDIAPSGPERLYVSRSALGPRRGGALGETILEAHLAAQGYEVFHPQAHDLPTQIARYRAARQIVALDGSALHLAAFAMGQHQRVAMIRRRNSTVSNAIALHLAAFGGQAPTVIDAVAADWLPKGRVTADRTSLGELDMPAVGRALAQAGFVDPQTEWPALDAQWRDAELARLRADHGRDYAVRPRGAALPDDAP